MSKDAEKMVKAWLKETAEYRSAHKKLTVETVTLRRKVRELQGKLEANQETQAAKTIEFHLDLVDRYLHDAHFATRSRTIGRALGLMSLVFSHLEKAEASFKLWKE